MITGGIKFFEPSQALAIEGASASATNGDSTAIYAIDRNPYTYWYTLGSNDSTTEVLTILFAEAKSINRLLLLLHNFKGFNVKYLLSGVYYDFANVKTMDGSLGTLTETACADGTSYYEFDQVSAEGLKISVTTAQVTNAEKFLSQVVPTLEIGTFAGFPTVKDLKMDRNSKVNKTVSGKVSVQKDDEIATFSLTFKNYPSVVAYNVDIDLVMELHDRDDPFLVWLCGGRRGANHFNYTLRGYRLQDLYQMQITKELKLGYNANVTKNQLNADVVLAESL